MGAKRLGGANINLIFPTVFGSMRPGPHKRAMVVGSVWLVCGYELTKKAQEALGLHFKEDEDEKMEQALKRLPKLGTEGLRVVWTPHEARWTTYEGCTPYIGIVRELYFDPSDTPPPTHPTRAEAGMAFLAALGMKKTLEAFGDVPPEWHTIPTDCNCCS
jgi:hypothetical protein